MSIPRQSDRAFGLTFAAVFAVISLVGFFVFETVLSWAIVIALVFLLIALAAPGILLPLNRLWGMIVARLSVVSNFIILGAFFYVMVFSFGLILKLFGRDPMERKFVQSADSYWVPVERHTDKETLPDMF